MKYVQEKRVVFKSQDGTFTRIKALHPVDSSPLAVAIRKRKKGLLPTSTDVRRLWADERKKGNPIHFYLLSRTHGPQGPLP